MFTWNAAFVLLAIALCMRTLPRNEWLSAIVASYLLGLVAIVADLSFPVAFGHEGKATLADRLFWFGLFLASGACTKGLVTDWLKGSRAGRS